MCSWQEATTSSKSSLGTPGIKQNPIHTTWTVDSLIILHYQPRSWHVSRIKHDVPYSRGAGKKSLLANKQYEKTHDYEKDSPIRCLDEKKSKHPPANQPRWWLNQPIWKILYSQIGSSPQVRVNIKKYFQPPPLSNIYFILGKRIQK